MADGLSLAANIIAVIDITLEVIKRLDEFRNAVEGIPRSLQVLAVQLPIFSREFKKIHGACENGSLEEERRAAILPLVADFEKQIDAIKEIIEKIKPKNPSAFARNVKAVYSFKYDADIERRTSAIMAYVATLSFERAVNGPLEDSAAPPPPPLVPTLIGPFDANPEFIDRVILADLIDQRSPGSRQAIVGGAGVGKTQIAIEYGHRIRQVSPDTWVFWVNASSAVKLEEGYRDIAKAVRISGWSDKDADLFSLVFDWLRKPSNGNWFLIVDNADDKDVFYDRPPGHRGDQRIRDFLPQSANGSILVTSRSREAAHLITNNYRYISQLEQMNEQEAIALLRSQLQEPPTEDDMKTLVKTLGYMPLAIHQAAAIISRKEITVSEYLQDLAKNDENSISLIDETSPEIRRDLNRSNSIVATWRVTFEYVSKINPSAARLLSLMCLFDWQDIPKALLEGKYGEEVTTMPPRPYQVWQRRRPRTRPKKPRPDSDGRLCNFEEDWLTLRDFCLIKLNRDRQHFSMHPLVQFTTKKWLATHQELNPWSQQFIIIINKNFSDCLLEPARLCEPLVPHANAAVPYRPVIIIAPIHKMRWLRRRKADDTATSPLWHWGSLVRKLADYYEYRGGFDTARKMYRVAAEALEASAGPEASETLHCHTRRCSTLRLMGRAAEAESIRRHVLIVRKQSLGYAHPDTLDTMESLGSDILDQDRLSEAEKIFAEALAIRLRVLGARHPGTINALLEYGQRAMGRKQYTEAYRYWHQAYTARSQNSKEELGDDWAMALDVIGLRLFISGRSVDAEPYMKESLAVKMRNSLGKENIAHHGVAESHAILARALRAQEKYVEAELQFRHAFEWYDKKLCNDQFVSDRLQCMSDFAHMLSENGHLQEAEPLARQCLAERLERADTKYGEEFECMWILGGILEKKKKYEDAVEYYQRAYDGSAKVLGEQHSDTEDYKQDLEKLQRFISEANILHSSQELTALDTVAGAQEDRATLTGPNLNASVEEQCLDASLSYHDERQSYEGPTTDGTNLFKLASVTPSAHSGSTHSGLSKAPTFPNLPDLPTFPELPTHSSSFESRFEKQQKGILA